MSERIVDAMRRACGAGVAPGACLAAIATLLLGVVCMVDALLVPGLFGPVAAVVVAAERLLCAARSSSRAAALIWSGIAFAWIAVAWAMLHTPMVSGPLLQWLVVAPIAANTACRLGSMPPSRTAVVWLIAAGFMAQLAMLFGAGSPPLFRVAAVAALELALTGVIGLLQVARPQTNAQKAGVEAGRVFGAPTNPTARMSELESGLA